MGKDTCCQPNILKSNKAEMWLLQDVLWLQHLHHGTLMAPNQINKCKNQQKTNPLKEPSQTKTKAGKGGWQDGSLG